MKARQLYLIPKIYHNSNFGGSTLVGKRKSARPISTKNPMHLIIKSDRAIFARYLKAHKESLHITAKLHHVKIMGFQFNGTHLHLVARFFTKQSYLNFIRHLTQKMILISKAPGAFKLRPFTRVVHWGRDLKNLTNYLFLNELENEGLHRRDAKKLALALGPP